MTKAEQDAKNAALYSTIFGDTNRLEAAVKSDPRFLAAAAAKQATEFQIVAPGDADPRPWKVSVKPNGHIEASRGSVVKPLLAAAAVFATAGLASGAIPGLVSAAAPTPPSVLGVSDPFTTLGATGGIVPGVTKAAAGFSIGKLLTAAAPSLISAGTNLYGAHVQASAANHAADQQKASADEALAFQRQQATHTDQVTESTRHANYDQWAAGQHRLQAVGDLLGLGPREIPSYVPLPTSSYDTPARGSVGALAAPPPPAGSPAGMVLMRAPNGSTRPVPATQQAYWQQRGAQLVSGSPAPGSVGAYL